LALTLGIASTAAAEPKPIAVIGALSGEAHIAGSSARPARARDWLSAGDVLGLDDGARLVVVFRTGRRFEVRGAARVTVRADALAPLSDVRELERLPAWPALPAVDPAAARGSRAAAIRVRVGTDFTGAIEPASDGVVLSDEAWLCFPLQPNASVYAIEVRDHHGDLVFQTRTGEGRVRVPAGTLQPGARYAWSVETVDHMGHPARAYAQFRTLDGQAAEARRNIRAHVEASGEIDAETYLQELDQALGLVSRTTNATLVMRQ
jgi:hypothetical protein